LKSADWFINSDETSGTSLRNQYCFNYSNINSPAEIEESAGAHRVASPHRAIHKGAAAAAAAAAAADDDDVMYYYKAQLAVTNFGPRHTTHFVLMGWVKAPVKAGCHPEP
jgi:hypothetical protein